MNRRPVSSWRARHRPTSDFVFGLALVIAMPEAVADVAMLLRPSGWTLEPDRPATDREEARRRSLAARITVRARRPQFCLICTDHPAGVPGRICTKCNYLGALLWPRAHADAAKLSTLRAVVHELGIARPQPVLMFGSCLAVPLARSA